MKQEDKDLLLKDLCARLPYGVICFSPDYEYGDIGKLWCVGPFEDLDPPITIQYPKGNTITKFCSEIKPYLRPMSSMTEEEINEAIQISRTKYYSNIGEWYRFVSINEKFLDWLLKNHFDFMELIPKGLAIEVTEENNPYKN